MFFRVRGNNVQVIKSIAQADGKAKNQGIGSINLLTGKENFRDDVKLTVEDKREIKDWLIDRQETLSLESNLRARTLDKTLQILANDILADRISFDQTSLEKLEYAMRQVRLACKKKVRH